MLHYLAYGSNLHPVRLSERVPSARLVGVIELSHHNLVFHKQSHDGSAKCNLFASGQPSDSVYGAIYSIAPEHKPDLDRFEGKGAGYLDEKIGVRHRGKELTCFSYFAQPTHITDQLKPYHWYKNLVVLGARYLEFPEAYIATIEAVESTQDPDRERRRTAALLIEKIRRFR